MNKKNKMESGEVNYVFIYEVSFLLRNIFKQLNSLETKTKHNTILIKENKKNYVTFETHIFPMMIFILL